MLAVKFFRTISGPEAQEEMGLLTFDGRTLQAHPNANNPKNEVALDNILRDNIYPFGRASLIDPKKDPEAWIKNLWRQYNGSAVTASKPIES